MVWRRLVGLLVFVGGVEGVLQGHEVFARFERVEDGLLGLSVKAANYSHEQLKAEQAILDSLKPGEDLVALQHAFDAADEAVKTDVP